MTATHSANPYLCHRNDEDPDKLIFKLKLVTDYNLDHARSFIMSYCLNNDNIYIYEKFAPEGGTLRILNFDVYHLGFLGVATGSFHSRKSVKKLNDPVTDVPGYVQPQDMYIGGEYLFNGQTFVIAETDECTAKFMEKYPARVRICVRFYWPNDVQLWGIFSFRTRTTNRSWRS